MADSIRHIRKLLECLEQKWTVLEDRVEVLEEQTCTNANRLDELEECQEKLEDLLEDEI
jgi:hypothetical protein